jgi:hypothetical protein
VPVKKNNIYPSLSPLFSVPKNYMAQKGHEKCSFLREIPEVRLFWSSIPGKLLIFYQLVEKELRERINQIIACDCN